MKEEMILSVNDLKAAYGQSTILWGVNIEVRKARVTTVMGRNGVGKSTLLKAIMGLVKAQSGSVRLDGQEIQSLVSYKIARAGVGYVPQGREIIPKLTVYENLRLGLEATPDYKEKISEEEIYDLFPILKEFRKRLGGNLSGGQQQQLAIARTLISGPKLLLLDEPTEGIQPSIAYEIGDIIRRLVVEKELSVLLVEQKIDFARHVTDHFYLMDRGKMVQDGSADRFDFSELQEHIAV
ncbi:urea ABC transporter ATP-binding subunit UrtE [Sphingobacterium paludis]|uniref:Urea ABC transporter ATP-binding protein n=1 Tax=Sphingobacterium paludis TaxID=1476465 RepID=A0A4R7DBC4_9SPHI|nr:urea ABC transporter ATP-binding subunit UrtE [Sphingobacterium paludis]TDS17184.1 urea ABC transporter ATP-binding protein [Sphingobacterium paludis]